MSITGADRRKLNILRKRLVHLFIKGDPAWGDVSNEIRMILVANGIQDVYDNRSDAGKKNRVRKQNAHAVG